MMEEVRQAEAAEVLRQFHERAEGSRRQLAEVVGKRKSGDVVLITFESEQNYFGSECRLKTLFEKDGQFYANKRKCHRGYLLPTGRITKIELIAAQPYDFEKDKERVKRMTHPNLKAWVCGNVDGGLEGIRVNTGRLKTRNITGLFNEAVLKELQEAIELKKNYGYGKRGTKRDYSVRTKICDDGVFRAWFSSEYAGCGNGDYYILINPTTALFVETD